MDQAPAAVSLSSLSVRDFMDRLSSSAPVPGGGSASAMAAGLGASLISMVAGLSLGRPKYEAYEVTHRRCDALGRELAARFLALADRDAEAYGGYAAALKMPRDTDDQKAARQQAIRSAARAASDAPWDCVRACLDLVSAAESLAGRSNVNASSDVLVAALLGEAAARGAAENVLINLAATGDDVFAGDMQRDVDRALHDIAALAARTREIVLSGQAREPEAE
jgi:formiminotetrahydrofolate cyclodeaminase